MCLGFFLDLTNMMTQPLESTVITCMQHFTAQSTREWDSCLCPICTARVACVLKITNSLQNFEISFDCVKGYFNVLACGHGNSASIRLS